MILAALVVVVAVPAGTDGTAGAAQTTSSSSTTACAKALAALSKAQSKYQALVEQKQAEDQVVATAQSALDQANAVIAQGNELSGTASAALSVLNLQAQTAQKDYEDVLMEVVDAFAPDPLKDLIVEAQAAKLESQVNKAVGQISRAQTNMTSGLWKNQPKALTLAYKSNVIMNKAAIKLLMNNDFYDYAKLAKAYGTWVYDYGAEVGEYSGILSFAQQTKTLEPSYDKATSDLLKLQASLTNAKADDQTLTDQEAAAAGALQTAEKASTAACPSKSGSQSPGKYSGGESQNGNPVWLYVSASGTQVQDLVIELAALSCAGGWGSSGPIVLDSVNILSNGSLSTTTTQSGYTGANNYITTFVITLAGTFGTTVAGTPEASGTYLETATYYDSENGTSGSCSSNSQTWEADRDSQPAQPAGVGVAGTYKGNESQNGNPLTFDVSGSDIDSVDFNLIGVNCNPGDGGVGTSVQLTSLPVSPDGSFSTSSSFDQDLNGTNVTYQFAFQGHFHGVDSSGASRAAGSYLLTGTYTRNGTSYDCSSSEGWWYAASSA
jgi:hypothetical protein